MKSRIEFFALVVFLSAFFPGCAIQKGPEPNARIEDLVRQDSGAKQEIRAVNAKLFASVKSAPRTKDYVLGEGDLLQVSIFEAPDLKTDCRVGARGYVTLPLVGAVEVTGLTVREAEKRIEELYSLRYIRNPHVNLFVKEQVSGKITLMGAVKKPGTYPYLTRQDLLSALALGEGLADNAGKTIQVRRIEPGADRPATLLIDLDELTQGEGSPANIEIKSGDAVFVPESGMVYVDGAVRKPGNYPVKRKMTVPEAIVSAGGLATYADESKVKLVRSSEAGKKNIVQLDLKELQKGTNIEVKDRDIIFVETNKVEALIYGLRLNSLGGLVGVGYEPPRQ